MGSHFLAGVALGAIGGACLAVAITSALAPAASTGATAREPSADTIERGMTRALGGVRDELRGIRDAIDARPADAASTTSTAVPPVSHDPSPGRARAERPAPSRDSAPVADREPGITVPEPNCARLLELDKWEDDRALRRRWLFASSREVLAAFGGPDGIQMHDEGVEGWQYDVPTGVTDEEGSPETICVIILMKDGRLIGVD